MSHTLQIRTQFKNSEWPCLRTAFEKLGWSIEAASKIRAYGSDRSENATRTYPYVARNPTKSTKQFDLGLMVADDPSKSDEALTVYGDTWDTSVEATLGKGLSGLKQAFGQAVIESEFPDAELTWGELQSDGSRLVEILQYA